MAMWGGVVAGIDMFNQQKNAEAELKVRTDAEERLKEQFSENKRLNRLNLAVESYRENETRGGKTTKNAEANADAVATLNNRLEVALVDMDEESAARLTKMIGQLNQVPSQALKVLTTLDKYNSDPETQNIQFNQLPEIVDIINFTEGDEEARITLSEIYGMDVNDDEQFENLLELVRVSPKEASLTVDFNPLKVDQDNTRFYDSQVRVFDTEVINRATKSKSIDPDHVAALGDLKNDPTGQRGNIARQYLYSIYMDKKQAEEFSSQYDTKLFKNVNQNPFLIGVINDPVIKNSTPQLPKPLDPRDSKLLISKQNDPNFTEIQKKFDDRYGAGASTKVLQEYFANQGQ